MMVRKLQNGMAVAVILAGIASCSAVTSAPDTPEAQLVLAQVALTGKAGGVAFAKLDPSNAATVRQILVDEVLPMIQDAQNPEQRGAVSFSINDLLARLLKDWPKYLGLGLAQFKLLCQQQGWLDTDAAYYVALHAVVQGFVDGISSVLPV